MKVLFKGGTVVDGSGKAPFKGDLLVENDTIVSVAPTLDVQADRVVDCKGLIVAPGFIDAHSHNDFFGYVTTNS